MPCESAQIYVLRPEIQAAVCGEPGAANRILSDVSAWLGPQPLATWQAFMAKHPANAATPDSLAVDRIRTLMLVGQVPRSSSLGLPRPPERIVSSAKDWVFAHTEGWVERGVKRQFFIKSSLFIGRFGGTQVTEHVRDAEQNAWESFLRDGCAAWTPSGGAALRTWAFRVASLRTIDYIRKLFRTPESTPMNDDSSDVNALPHQRTAREVPWEDLGPFKGTLGPYQRRLYELYYDPRGEGLSGAEIAQRLGKKTSAVHRMLAEVAKKLGVFFRESE